MPLIDAAAASAKSYDLCIIGAGPAGIALALEYTASGKRALLLDLGKETPDNTTDNLLSADLASPQTHVPVEEAVSPALGGTSHRWGGRVVPFDRQDFGPYDMRPNQAWQISYDEYCSWLPKAARVLGCGPNFTTQPANGWRGLDGVRSDTVEHLSPSANVATLNKAELNARRSLDLLTGAAAIGFQWHKRDDGNSAVGLDVVLTAAPGGNQTIAVKARSFAICAGGLETTRLLLIEKHRNPELFGGPDGPLGKYYMGHLTGSIAEIEFADHDGYKPFGYTDFACCGLARRRLTLEPPAPSNVAFWVENLRLADARHGSGELSLKYLLLRSARLGRLVVSEPLRRAGLAGQEGGIVNHFGNVVRQPLSAGSSIVRAIYKRFVEGERPHDRLLPSASRTYRLLYHAEQFPNDESFVQLSAAKDALGRPRLRINLAFQDRDFQAVLLAHRQLQAAIEGTTVATLKFQRPPTELKDDIARQARDGYHQIGTTRMGRTPADGVVDKDCKVFGTTNLFIASASVFPVSSQANPTLTITALAMRLGRHLSDRQSGIS